MESVSQESSMYPLVVCFFNMNRGEVTTNFWRMCLISNCTGLGIFEKVEEKYKVDRILWENTVALSVDNASVNLGKCTGFCTHFKKKNPDVFAGGCNCHILHYKANHVSDDFNLTSGFSIDHLLMYLYYYFDKSTKRRAESKEITSFCDQKYRKILKYGTTRCLSRVLPL